MALLLAIFLPPEKGIAAKLFVFGTIVAICGAALSTLRGIPFIDLLLLKDHSQFGKLIPTGYGLAIGSLIAWARTWVGIGIRKE